MKIKPEHYQVLKLKINALLDKNPQININDCITSMRNRWDLYWHCDGAFSNAQEYNYLDDNNIDTVLKHILNERIK